MLNTSTYLHREQDGVDRYWERHRKIEKNLNNEGIERVGGRSTLLFLYKYL
jgi:hypothetical protein